MEQLLERLFESATKVRILRLFMHNPSESFSTLDISRRTQVRVPSVKRELYRLKQVGVIKSRVAKETIQGGRSTKSKKANVFYTNADFPLFQELRDLIIRSSVTSKKKILRQIKAIGGVKLAVLSGMFLNSDNARTDLLVVGDDVKRAKLESFLMRMESEIGKSIQHTLMDTEEFRYRLGMYDRFLRDIFEYPHEKLINRLGL